ncbi:MAG: hypothetical protein Q4G42_03555 [Neisseria sp.]|nr:hypothetical protein [Neisseria sp.]
MTETTEIAIFDGVNIQQAAYMVAFSQADGLESIINQITEQALQQAEGIDASTASGRKKLASIAFGVARAKIAIDNAGKDLVTDAKNKIKVVDNNRKDVRDQLDALRDSIRQPVTEYEEAEKAKLAAAQEILARLAAMTKTVNADGERATAQQLRQRKEDVAAMRGVDYGEFAESISNEVERTLSELDEMIAAANAAEAQQAELERLRQEQAAREQAEREAQIAAEAAEKARAEAEAKAKAEQEAAQREKIEAQLRAEQAEREKQEAIERSEAEKQAAAEAERQRIAAEQAEKERQDAARAADVEHRRNINREILQTLANCGIAEDAAKELLIKMARGEVPHVSINY